MYLTSMEKLERPLSVLGRHSLVPSAFLLASKGIALGTRLTKAKETVSD